MASSRPSFPAPSEPNLRRLGVGGSGGDRPLKAQLVVASVAILLIVAVPLYFLRKPPSQPAETAEALSAAKRSRLIRTTVDAGPPETNISIGAVQRIKCSAAANRDGNEGPLCDRLPVLEAKFEQGIRESTDCAPRTGKEGTINYVLTVDFTGKHVNVFPGASGSWKGPQAKAAATCVKRAIGDIPWDTITHRYRYYVLAMLASYPAPDPMQLMPEFE